MIPAEPRRRAPAVNGVGQILGPILAGALSHRPGDPAPAVLAAAAVAPGGALLAAPDRRDVRALPRTRAAEEDACRT